MRRQEDRPRGDGGAQRPALGPLPARHSYTPEQVARHQRERLIAGLAAVVAEHGYAAATVGRIAAAAHVSRRSFYDHFEGKEECFLAAFDALFEHLRGLMRKAAARHPAQWAAGVIAALRAALDFYASEPDLARLALVASPAAGPAMQRRFGEIVRELAPYLAAGRRAAGGDSARSAAAGEPAGEVDMALVGGLASQLHRQAVAAGPESLPERLPAYVEYLLSPYLGAERARELAVASAGTAEGEPAR